MLRHSDSPPPPRLPLEQGKRPDFDALLELVTLVETWAPDSVQTLHWLIEGALPDEFEAFRETLKIHRAQRVDAVRSRLGPRMPILSTTSDEAILRLSRALEHINKLHYGL